MKSYMTFTSSSAYLTLITFREIYILKKVGEEIMAILIQHIDFFKFNECLHMMKSLYYKIFYWYIHYSFIFGFSAILVTH